MPRKFRKKRFFKKRRGRRRRFKRKRPFMSKISSIKLRTQVLPDNLFLKLPYNQRLPVFNTAILRAYSFRINSLFDPDATGIGTQPLGFDQWMNFYEKFEVRGSRIQVTVYNLSSTVTTEVIVYPSNSATAITATNTAIEQPYSRKMVSAGINSRAFSRMSNYITVKKLLGRQIQSVNYTGSESANPTVSLFWHTLAASIDGATNINIVMEVKLIYYVRLYKRISLASS